VVVLMAQKIAYCYKGVIEPAGQIGFAGVKLMA
jgi:hypothetical protein